MVNVPPPPPPPEDPFQNTGGEDPFASFNPGEESIPQNAPSVSAKPGRMLVVVGFTAAILGFILYMIFHTSEKPAAEQPKPTATPVSSQLPIPVQTPPPVSLPAPIVTPPSIPQPTKMPILKPEDDDAAQKARQLRLRSTMVIASGGGGGVSSLLGSDSAASTPSADSNSAFEASVTKSNSKASSVTATHIGDLRRTIAQGRIIQATTESAVNTELPAPIRAIVSRDVYGEAGKKPLIPKGSRLIGVYNTAIGSGQSRVFVVWTRVIRPDGVDIMINSPLVDQLGTAGIGGQVDTKFQEIFSQSILASVVGIAFAIGSDKISGGSTTTTTNGSGTSTTGDASTTATVNALNRLGSTTDGYLQKLVGVNPTILVDQGTAVNVFVNHDLIFPAEYVGEGRVVE